MADKKRLEDMKQAQQPMDVRPSSYRNSLNEAAMDRKAEFISSKIKSSVRQTMEGMLLYSLDYYLSTMTTDFRYRYADFYWTRKASMGVATGGR